MCMYWTDVSYELDWCVVCCTGLVCCMYWTGILHVLDWCVYALDWCDVRTGLMCCLYYTGVLPRVIVEAMRPDHFGT